MLKAVRACLTYESKIVKRLLFLAEREYKGTVSGHISNEGCQDHLFTSPMLRRWPIYKLTIAFSLGGITLQKKWPAPWNKLYGL